MVDAGISGVLPLKRRGGHYRHNLARCRILFSSLTAFAAPDLFREIFVVVPRRDRKAAEDLQGEWLSLPIKIIVEDDILPVFGAYPRVGGWFRQQIIKLYAATVSTSEFVLTLDPDVILCKPLRRDDIVIEGKALLEHYPRSAHPEWWTGAADILGLAPDLSAPGMFVTPALLSRTLCRRLIDHVEERYQQHWAAALLARVDRQWTEYSLYYLAAEHYGLLDQFHHSADDRRRLTCASGVWADYQFAAWNVDACFAPDAPGFFAVVQSNTGIRPPAVTRRIHNYLVVEEKPRQSTGWVRLITKRTA